MQDEQSTHKAKTATMQQDAVNMERPPAIKDIDQFLPLPGRICVIDSYDAPIPWYRRLTDRVAGWFR
jgi:hypothetical protein